MPFFESELPFTECFGTNIQFPPSIKSSSSPSEAIRRLQDSGQFWTRRLLTTKEEHDLFREELQNWEQAFQNLVKEQKSFTSLEERGMAMLRVYRIYLNEHLYSSSRLPVESRRHSLWWDTRVDQNRELVEHAKVAMELFDKPSGASSSFSMDSFLNVAICAVAQFCRDPVIRRKAVALVSSANRHEGFWRADVVAIIMETIILFEEKGLGNVHSCDDVPLEARIQDMQILFDSVQRIVTVRYMIRDRWFTQILSLERGLPRDKVELYSEFELI